MARAAFATFVITGCSLLILAGIVFLAGIEFGGGQFGDAQTLDVAMFFAAAFALLGLVCFPLALLVRRNRPQGRQT